MRGASMRAVTETAIYCVPDRYSAIAQRLRRSCAHIVYADCPGAFGGQLGRFPRLHGKDTG